MSMLGLGLALGGASLLGGILNASSAARANSISEEQYRESLDFQKYQYADQKRYNSAVSEVQRLRQAGINPSLGLGAGGSISSVSSPSPGVQHPVDYSGIMNSAASIASSLSQGELNEASAEEQNTRSMKNKAEAFNTLLRNYNQYDKDVADIYRMRNEGKLSKEKADSELAFRSVAIDSMKSQVRAQNMQADLFEQQTKTEIEKTAQEAATAKIMEFRLSKEPERFSAELQTLVSETAENYAQAYLAKVNAKSIEELTPKQKEALAAGIQKAVSETTLNKKNSKLLEKRLGAFETDKWFERGATIVSGITQGVMMGLGIGYFARGAKAATKVVGFGN